MNKHTKIAILVAPVLAVLGWIASDLFLSQRAMETRLYALSPEAGFCDILAKQCILRSGELKLSVYDDSGTTTVNSTFPLDRVTLFLVDDESQVSVYPMGMKDSPYYWFQRTPLRQLNASAGSKQKVRLIATVKGGQYMAEFVSTTFAN